MKLFTVLFMQQTIGERLQQARQRQGLSLEDIATKLNVRKDLLFKFESNEFAIHNLPKIYIRGFFRSYVKFLKLNETALLSEYEAIMGEEGPTAISLGHLQIEKGEPTVHDEPSITEIDSQESSAKFVKPIFQFIYFKKLIWIAVALLSLLLLIICWPSSKSSLEISEIKTEATTSVLKPVYEEITLVASETVQVFVRQEDNKRRLFAGTLNKNEKHSIVKEGVLQISFSEGDYLSIERSDGTTVRPQKSGRGWIRIQ